MEFVNHYAGLTLDRATERRRDAAWVAARLEQPAVRIVPLWQLKPLVVEAEAPEPVFLSAGDIDTAGSISIYLGDDQGVPYFALDLSHLDEAAAGQQFGARGAFVDLRALGPRIDRRHGSLLGYARGLLYWHSRHRFCGVCGAPTRVEAAGHLRVCTDPACGVHHFPRTDPAVIMLVTHGDSCLLARQRQWPPGQHSALAGFVEPGESLEDAVRREVYE